MGLSDGSVEGSGRFKASTLAAFAERHIAYEVGMTATGTLLLHQPPGVYGEALKNAILESVLIHLRLLDEFVGRQPQHAEDVAATDYLATWIPVDGGPLMGYRALINWQVAHVSIRREAGRLWNVLELATEVLTECQRFFDELSTSSSPYVDAFSTASDSATGFLEWAEATMAWTEGIDASAPGAFEQTLDRNTNPVDVREFHSPPPRYFGS